MSKYYNTEIKKPQREEVILTSLHTLKSKRGKNLFLKNIKRKLQTVKIVLRQHDVFNTFLQGRPSVF